MHKHSNSKKETTTTKPLDKLLFLRQGNQLKLVSEIFGEEEKRSPIRLALLCLISYLIVSGTCKKKS